MYLQRACWRRFLYPSAWALYFWTLLRHVHPSSAPRNIFWKSLVRACEIAPVLVQFLTGKCRCCCCLFVLPLLFGFSAYIACWSVAGGWYWTHMWQHWRLWLVGRLARWFDMDLLLRFIMAPGVVKEMIVQTCVQQCSWPGCLDGILQLPLWVRRFPWARGGLCENGSWNWSSFVELNSSVSGF